MITLQFVFPLSDVVGRDKIEVVGGEEGLLTVGRVLHLACGEEVAEAVANKVASGAAVVIISRPDASSKVGGLDEEVKDGEVVLFLPPFFGG